MPWVPGRTAYPRACGATGELQPQALHHSGLPPRVRGNPNPPTFYVTLFGAYPRACGATVGEDGDTVVWSGLPPRVRGNPFRNTAVTQKVG